MIKRRCSFNRGCKSQFGENDHRSPSKRAQGHAYGQNACGVTSPTSRLQSYKNKKKTDSRAYPLQCLNSLLSSNPGTTLNYILASHCNWLLFGSCVSPGRYRKGGPDHHIPNIFIRRWPRAPIATSGLWGSPRPSHEWPLVHGDGPFCSV